MPNIYHCTYQRNFSRQVIANDKVEALQRLTAQLDVENGEKIDMLSTYESLYITEVKRVE